MIHPFIFYAEDIPFYREMLEYALEDCTFNNERVGLDNLTFIERAHEAVDFIMNGHEKTLKKSFFLIDITFDNSPKDGWDVLEAVQDKYPERPCALLTSSERPSDRERAKREGVNFIIKDMGESLDTSMLTRRIQGFLDHIASGSKEIKEFV